MREILEVIIRDVAHYKKIGHPVGVAEAMSVFEHHINGVRGYTEAIYVVKNVSNRYKSLGFGWNDERAN